MDALIKDRAWAGQQLASRLLKYRKRHGVLVLALPRGGVPVAAEIAYELHAPLDILLVRKLGAPGQEELALGAIASGGVRVLNESVVASLGISEAEIERLARREHAELERRLEAYRANRPPPAIGGHHVIIVDDGMATGATMHAAVDAVRQQDADSVTVAIPIAPFEALTRLRRQVDEVVCLATPDPFGSIGIWYESFPQLEDQDVRSLLAARWADEDAASSVGQVPPRTREGARQT
jgi:putative phosphoribosyl transferase